VGQQLGVVIEQTTAASKTVVWAGHSDVILFTRINCLEKKLGKYFFPQDIVRNLGILLNNRDSLQ